MPWSDQKKKKRKKKKKKKKGELRLHVHFGTSMTYFHELQNLAPLGFSNSKILKQNSMFSKYIS